MTSTTSHTYCACVHDCKERLSATTSSVRQYCKMRPWRYTIALRCSLTTLQHCTQHANALRSCLSISLSLSLSIYIYIYPSYMQNVAVRGLSSLMIATHAQAHVRCVSLVLEWNLVSGCQHKFDSHIIKHHAQAALARHKYETCRYRVIFGQQMPTQIP